MKHIFNKVSLFALIMLLSLGLVACGQTNGKDEVLQTPESSQVAENTAEETKNAETTYPVTVTDSFGKEITLNAEPQKVISVAPNITELMFSLGLQDKLVGRTNYCDYPAEAANIESIGTLKKPDMEKIISLEPDVVITSTHFDEENTKKLEEAGITVVGLYEEHEVTGVYTMIETMGKMFNKQEAASTIVEEMKTTIEGVQTAVKDLKKPSVYYVVSYGEYGDYTAPVNTFVGQLIGLAGGEDIVPASDSWSFTLEALLEADPEIIIVRTGDKEGFMAAEGYKDLTAVKAGKVYEIDNNLLDRQSNRNAEGVKTLAEIFHPEAFK